MMLIWGVVAFSQLMIAAVHSLWAMRIWWPFEDETCLARAVVGARGITKMPGPGPCCFVAVALVAASFWAFLPEGRIRNLGLMGLGLIFIMRGIVGFLPIMDRLTPEEPFRTYNRRYYNAICLALGAGHLTMFVEALT